MQTSQTQEQDVLINHVASSVAAQSEIQILEKKCKEIYDDFVCAHEYFEVVRKEYIATKAKLNELKMNTYFNDRAFV